LWRLGIVAAARQPDYDEGTMLDETGGPSVRRIALGARLRQLREANGISRKDAGDLIRGSESKITRMELGKVSFKERDVSDLLTLYGVVEPAERAPLLSLLTQANQRGWWRSFTDVMPDWFHSYVGLETSASLIRVYETQFIPGLLQTEEYARAVITRGGDDLDATTVDRRISARMNRQALLARPEPPRVWAVIDEAALQRPLAEPVVMCQQLEHLIALDERPNITIQVIALDSDSYPAEGGAFTMLRFADPEVPDVVYLEHLTGASYLDRAEDVARYMHMMNNLCLSGTKPGETAEAIRAVAARHASRGATGHRAQRPDGETA